MTESASARTVPSDAPIEDGRRRRSHASTLAIVATVTIIAAILRILYIGKSDLWADEAISIAFARMPMPAVLHLLTTHESNMSLYYLILRGWLYLGDNETCVRMLSVVFAVATVPPLYALATRLAGRRVGLLTAMLFAVNAWAIRYAQETRGYTLWMLLGIGSWLFFMRSLERPTRGNLAGYIATTAFGFYAHLFSALSYAAQWLAIGLFRRHKMPWRPLIVSGAAAALLGVPMFVSERLGAVGQINWIAPTSLRDIKLLLYGFSGSIAGGPLASALPGMCLIFAAWGLVAMFRRAGISPRTAQNLALIVLGAALPAAIVLSISVLVRPIYTARYMFESLPSFAMLVAIGLASARPRWIGTASLAAILSLSLYQDYRYYRFFVRDDWRGPTSYVLHNARVGDGLVIFDSLGRWPYDYYVSRADSSDARPELIFPKWDDQFRVGGTSYPIAYSQTAGRNAVLMREVGAAAGRYPRIWLVLYHNNIASIGTGQETQRLLSALKLHYRMTAEKDFAEVSVMLFD